MHWSLSLCVFGPTFEGGKIDFRGVELILTCLDVLTLISEV